jgi:hypothetical protein
MGFGQAIPIRLYAFEDGLAISAAGPSYARYVGARVLRIGPLTAQEALRRTLEISPGDNDMTRLDRTPFFLTMPPILHALGITPDSDRVTFQVRTVAGATERFTAQAVADTTGSFDWFFEGEGLPIPGTRTAHDRARAPLPLHLRDPQRAYWFDWDPKLRLLYVQLRRVQYADEGRTFADFIRGVFAFGDSVKPETFVLDLRHDHGGNTRSCSRSSTGSSSARAPSTAAGTCSPSSGAGPSRRLRTAPTGSRSTRKPRSWGNRPAAGPTIPGTISRSRWPTTPKSSCSCRAGPGRRDCRGMTGPGSRPISPRR